MLFLLFFSTLCEWGGWVLKSAENSALFFLKPSLKWKWKWFLKVKPQQTDAECPITGGSKDIYSERTNRYYAKQIQAIRKDE